MSTSVERLSVGDGDEDDVDEEEGRGEAAGGEETKGWRSGRELVNAMRGNREERVEKRMGRLLVLTT